MRIRKIISLLGLGLALAAPTLSHAHEHAKAAGVSIETPWARATVAGQPAGGGFLNIRNSGPADTLLSVSANVSESVELHTMEMKDQVMRMRHVDGIAVPANGAVALQPGGYHIMFMKLKAPLKAGSTFPATLKFERAGEVHVQFKVEPVNFKPQGAAAKGHAH